MGQLDGSIRYQCDGPEVHLLDESSAIPPAISRTWFVSLVSGFVRRKQPDEVVEESDESGGSGAVAVGGETGRRAPASKAGGRRRAVRRR